MIPAPPRSTLFPYTTLFRSENERNRVEKSYCEVEIVVSPDRRVEVKNKSGQTERRKVESIRRASTLFEKHKETDQQIHNADQVDVQDAWRPLMNSADVVEVSPVGSDFRRVGRPFNQVMQLAVLSDLFEIDLHVPRTRYLIGLAYAIEADTDQPVAW